MQGWPEEDNTVRLGNVADLKPNERQPFGKLGSQVI